MCFRIVFFAKFYNLRLNFTYHVLILPIWPKDPAKRARHAERKANASRHASQAAFQEIPRAGEPSLFAVEKPRIAFEPEKTRFHRRFLGTLQSGC